MNHDLLFPTAEKCEFWENRANFVVDQSSLPKNMLSADRLSPIAHPPISSQDLQVLFGGDVSIIFYDLSLVLLNK